MHLYSGRRPAHVPANAPQAPKPYLALARFSSQMTSVDLTFTRATQQPRETTAASRENCERLLKSETLALLGTGAVCSWSSPAVFTIKLGTSFEIRPTLNSVSLRGGVVRSETFVSDDPVNYLDATILVVSASDTPVTPTVALRGLSKIGPCEAFTLSSSDSSNSGGLAFWYSWSLSGTPEQTLAFDEYIIATYGGANSNAPFTATSSPLYAPTLTLSVENLNTIVPMGMSAIFSLSVRSWFGLSSISTFSLFRDNSVLPGIVIAGSKEVETKPPRNLLINALITRVGICSGAQERATISYTWEQILSGGEQPVNSTRSLASLRVRAYDMPARTAPYIFRVNVSDTNYTNSDTVRVQVVASALRAVITGGDKVHSKDRDLLISGALSRDPDVNPAVASQYEGLMYTWSCANALLSNVTKCFTNDVILTLNTSVLTVPQSAMLANVLVSSSQMWTLAVRSADNRTATARTRIDLVNAEPAYTVSVSAPERSQLLQQNNVILTATVARINNVPTAADEIEKPLSLWSCDTRNANVDELGIVLYSASSPATDGSGNMVHTLTLAGDKLAAGVPYTFRFSLF